jgi:(p)ppGpp synthase/HD superfamily hydrolase
VAVACLHDAVEDSRCTIDEISKELDGNPEIIDGVLTLTKKDHECYEDFISRIKSHRDGRWVRIKIADILANLSDSPTDRQIRKYAMALLVLLR